MCRTWPWDTGDQKSQAGHEPCAQTHEQWRRRRIVHSSRRTRWSPYKTAAAANGLAAPFARTDIRKYSFAVRTVEHWNNLPEGARTANSQQSFKELLKNIKMKAPLDRTGRSHWWINEKWKEKHRQKKTGGRPKILSKIWEIGRKKGCPHTCQYVSTTLLHGDLDTPPQVSRVSSK